MSDFNFILLKDTGQAFILRPLAEDQSQGSLVDVLQCEGHEVTIVDRLSLAVDGQYHLVTAHQKGKVITIIGNERLYAEAMEIKDQD